MKILLNRSWLLQTTLQVMHAYMQNVAWGNVLLSQGGGWARTMEPRQPGLWKLIILPPAIGDKSSLSVSLLCWRICPYRRNLLAHSGLWKTGPLPYDSLVHTAQASCYTLCCQLYVTAHASCQSLSVVSNVVTAPPSESGSLRR